MKNQFLSSIKIFMFFTLLFGVAYPLCITLFAQVLFKQQAHGSLIKQNNTVIGSELIAQKITSVKYFWPRPSASDYNALPSGASNLSLTSTKLQSDIKERQSMGATHDLLFASASGLDPHISKDAALSQLPRVLTSRNLNENQRAEILKLIDSSVEKRQLGFLGEERINVLKLNLALDKLLVN